MIKRKSKALFGLTLIVSCILICFIVRVMSIYALENINSKINYNNTKIEQIKEIKHQLHITAELVRQESSNNNGFDYILGQKWQEYDAQQKSIEDENKRLLNSKRFVGNFKITHYCPCSTCNGGYGNKTASGTTVTPYKTIAVDPKVIPLGSKVEIQGKTYIAEDTGGAIKGNKIDICVGSHAEAYRIGVLKNVPVYIITE